MPRKTSRPKRILSKRSVCAKIKSFEKRKKCYADSERRRMRTRSSNKRIMPYRRR